MSGDQYTNFRDHYSDSKFQKKLGKLSGSLREGVLLLHKLLRDPDAPLWIKLLAVGVLGYVICPFDLIPDFLPFGYTDDLAALASALLTIRQEMSSDMKGKRNAKTL